jgi:hypothetical protein
MSHKRTHALKVPLALLAAAVSGAVRAAVSWLLQQWTNGS